MVDESRLSDWHATRVTERLGTRYPIVQGAFGGGLSTPELVAAVANAGGLGSFGANGLSPDQIEETARAIRHLTRGPFALNLWVPVANDAVSPPTPAQYRAAVTRLRPYFAELDLEPPTLEEILQTPMPRFEQQLEAVLKARPPAFSFIFGIPPVGALAECRRLGIVTVGTATNVAEGQALDEAGVDLIVASGSEAGGHRASFLRPVAEALATSALVPQVVDRVGVPVIAAGGIADGRGVAAAFALGAEGAQVGTAFLASVESGASAAHREALVRDGERSTMLTRAFTGRYARGLLNRFIREMAPHEAELPAYPWQNLLTLPFRRAAATAAMGDLLAMWAGQNVALVKARTAQEVMEFLVADTDRVLSRLGSLQPAEPHRMLRA
jgi:nitronate monooxygenase